MADVISPAPVVPPGPAGRDVRSPCRRSTTRSGGSSTTGAVRCWCWPGRAPARPRRVVEAVVARIEAGADPEQVLVLTFGRRAAAELREPHHRPARPGHQGAAGPHLPLLRVRRAAPRGGRCGASRRRGCSPARSRTSWSATCSRATWPPAPPTGRSGCSPALPTRGFAQELRDLVMRAVRAGRDRAASSTGSAGSQGRDDWQAAARFMRQYAGVTALQDAAELRPGRADPGASSASGCSEPELLAAERAARPHVFVDELQDTDPAQVELLSLLAGGGRDLVAVGDPDQSIYGFRGADVAGHPRLPRHVPHRDRRAGAGRRADAPAARSGPDAARGQPAGRPRPGRRRGGHRDLLAGRGPARRVSWRSPCCAPSRRRRRTSRPGCGEAHLVDGVPVVADGGAGALHRARDAGAAPGVGRGRRAGRGRRRRGAAGAAARGARRCCSCCAARSARDRWTRRRPSSCSLAARRGRRAGAAAAAAGAAGARAGRRRRRPSGPLLVEAVDDPRAAGRHRAAAASRPAQVARLLAAARGGRDARGPPPRTCSGRSGRPAGWPSGGSGASPRPAARRAQAADRDLDAVVALFDAAARFSTGCPVRGPRCSSTTSLGQQIPGRLARGPAPTGDAVRLLTAHASQGPGVGPRRASPACRRASGRTCGCAARCSAPSGWSTCCGRRRAPPARGAVATSAGCWTRSAGCSTSP